MCAVEKVVCGVWVCFAEGTERGGWCVSSTLCRYNWSNLVAVMDCGGANSRFLGLVSVWAARSFDQTALRPSVIKRIRQIDVKYITHITSFGVTA